MDYYYKLTLKDWDIVAALKQYKTEMPLYTVYSYNAHYCVYSV